MRSPRNPEEKRNIGSPFHRSLRDTQKEQMKGDPGPSPSRHSGDTVQRSGDCAKSDMGSLTPSLSDNGSASKASATMAVDVTEGTASCKCSSYRWIQVADIIPGEWNGRAGSLVDPFPNDDSDVYYYTSGEHSASPMRFWDQPGLARSRSVTEGSRITTKFELAAMCVDPGKTDRVIATYTWGFSFDSDQSKDALITPAKNDKPTSFWKDAVKSDFSTYSYVE